MPATQTHTVKNSQAILYALMFLTRLPVGRWLTQVDDHTAKRAVLFYPLVGVVVGLLLFVAAYVFAWLGPHLAAALVLVLWVAVTGALHLDGLADCMDAYYAGHKCINATERRQRVLAVMHDPACGAVALVSLILLLLVKWAALSTLLSTAANSATFFAVVFALLVAPILARTIILPFMTLTNYARQDGTVPKAKPHTAMHHWAVALAVFTLCALTLGFVATAALLLGLIALMLFWSRLWQRQIGGYTGDCLGALVELSETLVLIGLVALW